MVIHAGAAKDRRGAAELLARDGDLPPRETPEDRQAREEAAARSRAARMAVAATVWRSGEPIAATAAETYLRRARAVSAPLQQAALRFSPAVPLRPYAPDGRTAPALLARVVDGSGAPIGAHLTYLQPDGAGKAKVAVQRKMVGLVGGGHVRLIQGASLVVGEGLESTSSAWEQAAAERGAAGLGASAALSAGEVARFVWPADTRELIISPDRDEKGAGERGARELGRPRSCCRARGQPALAARRVQRLERHPDGGASGMTAIVRYDPSAEWPEPDLRLLNGGARPAPPFPMAQLGVLGPPLAAIAASKGAPIDYLALPLFCSAGGDHRSGPLLPRAAGMGGADRALGTVRGRTLQQ